MAKLEKLTVRVVLKNAKAVRALAVVGKVLEDLLEDFGYRDDVKRAAKACTYAAKHLTIVGTADDGRSWESGL